MKTLLILFSVILYCKSNNGEFPEENAPDILSCLRQSDLTDSNGKYLKSVCQTFDELSYSEAIEKCLENGMKLFIINNATTEAALYKFADSVWPKYFGAALWVNGKKDINSGNWYINNNGSKEPLFGGIRRWSTRYTSSYDSLEHCLQTSNLRGNFSVDYFDCNQRMTSFCEYDSRLIYNYKKDDRETISEDSIEDYEYILNGEVVNSEEEITPEDADDLKWENYDEYDAYDEFDSKDYERSIPYVTNENIEKVKECINGTATGKANGNICAHTTARNSTNIDDIIDETENSGEANTFGNTDVKNGGNYEDDDNSVIGRITFPITNINTMRPLIVFCIALTLITFFCCYSAWTFLRYRKLLKESQVDSEKLLGYNEKDNMNKRTIEMVY